MKNEVQGFEYKGIRWAREGPEFFRILEHKYGDIWLKTYPHCYFEAYTEMKNEEGKKYAKLNS